MTTYTESDLAAAWESGYWHGTSHTGPLNDAAVRAKNPYIPSGATPAKVCKIQLKTETTAAPSPKSAAVTKPTTSK